MKLLCALTSCFLLATSFPSLTWAETITSSFDSGGYLITEIKFKGQLDLFDSSLGTLTGATLRFEDAFISTLNMTNDSSTAQFFRFKSDLTSTRSSSLAGVNAVIGGNETFNLFDTGFVNIASNTNVVYGPYETGNNLVFDMAAYLGELQQLGGGSFDISLATLTGSTLTGGGGNLDYMQTTRGLVNASITYTYTPASVPEPSSLLLSAGGIALFLLRRRRVS